MEALILSSGPDPDKNKDFVKYCQNLTLEEINAMSNNLGNVYKICKEIYDQKYKEALDEGFPRYSELPRDIKREILSVYPKSSKKHYYLDKESKELMSPLLAKRKCNTFPTQKEVMKYIADGNAVQSFEGAVGPLDRTSNYSRLYYRLFIDGYEYNIRNNLSLAMIEISDVIGPQTGRGFLPSIDYLSIYNIVNNRPLCRYLPNAGKKHILKIIRHIKYDFDDYLFNFVRMVVNLHAFGLQDFHSLPKSMSVEEVKSRNQEMYKQLADYVKSIPDNLG